MSKVVVLGAGPAGLAAALELARQGVQVTLVEKNAYVGGNASSFTFGGVNVDYGSHRLHPASDPVVLENIRELLGDDLLTRPRHGRINLLGRWIHFPLRPTDILLKGKPTFTFGVLTDLAKKVVPAKKKRTEENFATVLNDGLGSTICEEFYFPYAKKIWGVNPDKLSATQAYKRVSAGTIGKMIKRLMPWSKGSGGANTKGIFYYPRNGYGQICQAYYQAAMDAGVAVKLNCGIESILINDGNVTVSVNGKDDKQDLQCDQIFSTIPLTTLSKLLNPKPPASVLAAAEELQFRSMVLVYLHLNQPQFSEYDAHYFPGKDIPFTRISEPKNYSDLNKPDGATVLCAEMPCFVDDTIWQAEPNELASLVTEGLQKLNIPVSSDVLETVVKKIRFAYPLYTNGYEKQFNEIDNWIDSIDEVLTFGRQGLYAHDNTHHAIYMALKAVDCLDDSGKVNRLKWQQAREIFAQHVVED